MQKETEYLDKKLFKNLLDNLSYLVDKTNGVIQLRNKDNQRDLISYLLGYKNYKNYLNHLVQFKTQDEIDSIFKKITNQNKIDNAQENVNFIKYDFDFKNKLKKYITKKHTELKTNQNCPQIKVGSINDKSLKTPYDIFLPIENLQVLTKKTEEFSELLCQHLLKNKMAYIQIKNGKLSNIDLIEEFTVNDLWEDVFFSQNDDFSILFMTIIQQFFITNEYKIEIDLLKKSISIPGLFFIMNSEKSTVLLKKMIKKHFQKIGFKDEYIRSNEIYISKDVIQEHKDISEQILNKVSFLEHLYSEGYFVRNNRTIIQTINEQGLIQIGFNHLTNLLILPLINSYKEIFIKSKIYIINQTDLSFANLGFKNFCSIGENLQDNWQDFDNTLMTNINEINLNSDFFAYFYNKTQNLIPIFNIKNINHFSEETFLWKKLSINDLTYEIYQINQNNQNEY